MNPEKITDLTPAPFDQRLRNITNGQRNIIKLLSSHIQTGIPVTKDDIIDCYIESVSMNGKKILSRYVSGTGWSDGGAKYEDVEVTLINDYETPSKAMGWFQRNLGCCILKGGLMVIPVIEI